MLIDFIDKLEMPDDKVKIHYNELHSLNYLAAGLKFLYDQVQKLEAEIASRIPKDKKSFHFSNSPVMKGIPQDLVACSFHWYAVTLCNYAKLVGWLANNGDSIKAREYMERVLPQVYLWRHKVAAHFAIIDPQTKGRHPDTAADLAKSVMFPLSFDDDAFYANSLGLTMTQKGKSSTSRHDMRWSLTHTHRNLISRYWPY